MGFSNLNMAPKDYNPYEQAFENPEDPSTGSDLAYNLGWLTFDSLVCSGVFLALVVLLLKLVWRKMGRPGLTCLTGLATNCFAPCITDILAHALQAAENAEQAQQLQQQLNQQLQQANQQDLEEIGVD